VKTKVQDVETSRRSLITANTGKCGKYARGLVITAVSAFLPFHAVVTFYSDRVGRALDLTIKKIIIGLKFKSSP